MPHHESWATRRALTPLALNPYPPYPLAPQAPDPYSWEIRPSPTSSSMHPSYSTPSFAVREVEIDEVGLEDMKRQVISAIVKKASPCLTLNPKPGVSRAFT